MIADRLRQFQPETPIKFADLYTVTALGDDPRCVVVTDGNPGGELTVPCLASYQVRAVGDKVFVIQLSGGSWLCVGHVDVDVAAPASVTYGMGAPAGGGWRSFSTGYVRDRADGTREIYCDTNGSIPLPSTVAAQGAAGFLSNTDTQIDFPRSGAASASSGDWFGCWFYNSAISAACAGKTVSGMSVRIARAADGGRNAPTVLRLGLHNSTGLVPNITNTWTPGVLLSRGGAVIVDIPVQQRNLLAQGAAQGVAVQGFGPDEYADYSTSADVTITFA